jgi:hypothetical protein
MYYDITPSPRRFDGDGAGGAFYAAATANGHHGERDTRDENAQPNLRGGRERPITLDELHRDAKGVTRTPGGSRWFPDRPAFGNISNSSRLVEDALARGRARKGNKKAQRKATASAKKAAAASAAAASRAAPAPQPEPSPRTPVVESPEPAADSPGVGSDDDTLPATVKPAPGALTIARIRRARDAGVSPDALDAEMEAQHRAQQRYGGRAGPIAFRESGLCRLLMWRDVARTLTVLSVGVAALAVVRAPTAFASVVRVNPVVICSYVAMAYLTKAWLLASVFPRRTHGLKVDADAVVELAVFCASCVNALTAANETTLSGRSNRATLVAFTGAYGVSLLGGLLNSAWVTALVLWVGAFTVPIGFETHRAKLAKALDVVDAAAGARWRKLESNKRWGVAASVAVTAFVLASAWTRVVMAFIACVAMRLYRETHAEELKGFERVVKDSCRRLSRAGSEFHAYCGSPAQFLYRRGGRQSGGFGVNFNS